MTKSKAGRASKFTSQAIEKIKEMVAQGVNREEIAQLLDVTVGSLQVTCSRLGISLRRPRMRYSSYERLKLQLPDAGSKVELVEKARPKGKVAITMQQGDVLRTIDVPLSNKASGGVALLASPRRARLGEGVAKRWREGCNK